MLERRVWPKVAAKCEVTGWGSALDLLVGLCSHLHPMAMNCGSLLKKTSWIQAAVMSFLRRVAEHSLRDGVRTIPEELSRPSPQNVSEGGDPGDRFQALPSQITQS
ncbi:hypothetical protein AMECASPLE_035294 [Ameca splendens]|uniref:Uncharacterized protein n=1 Tax=Ameca splendens TaxID=208324 RepID=A0ABV0ZSV4_9TELE